MSRQSSCCPSGRATPTGSPTISSGSCPSLRIVLSDARTAFDLKNEGARAARAPLVAFLDADCDPVPGWLRAAVETMRAHPDVAVVSGRTLSPARSRRERIVSLAGRAVGDEGVAGPTIHLALNDVVYRRDVILRHPLRPTPARAASPTTARRSGGRGIGSGSSRR